MPVAKRPGYYVEGRFFRDNYHQALARANFLAKEYGRTIDVEYLAPEDCGNVNNAVPFVVTTAGIPSIVRNVAKDASASPVKANRPFLDVLAEEYSKYCAGSPAVCPSYDEIDVRGWIKPENGDV
jgi:hypothetical protein